MMYVCVQRTTEEEDEPNLIYSELDDSRLECRRVEFYPDGLGSAYGGVHGREEALSREPFPEDLRTLNRPGEVEARAIPGALFQEMWGQAQERAGGFFGMFA